jgi:hypothetical protein
MGTVCIDIKSINVNIFRSSLAFTYKIEYLYNLQKCFQTPEYVFV